jgi:hypothetical protein
MVGWRKIIEDLIILIAALLPAIFTQNSFSLENLSSD